MSQWYSNKTAVNMKEQFQDALDHCWIELLLEVLKPIIDHISLHSIKIWQVKALCEPVEVQNAWRIMCQCPEIKIKLGRHGRMSFS